MTPVSVPQGRDERPTSRLVRAFAVAFVLLVVLDVVLRTPVYPNGFPDDFRIPKDTLMEYDAFTDWIAEQDGVRVAVLGDSVIEGHVVGRGETLPARMDAAYEAAGRDVDVYNLALRAARANDLFAVAADLTSSDAVDLVVVQFDYIYYGNDEAVSARYWDILTRAADVAPFLPAELESMGASFAPVPENGAVENAVGRVWRLYRERDHIDAVAFGGRPADAIERAVLDFGRDAANLPGARQLRPDELDPDNLEDYFGWGTLDQDNVQLAYLRMLVEKSIHDGVPVVVFNNPIYFDGIAHWGALDEDAYAANIETVRDVVEAAGGTWVDLADEFPQEYLLDTVHLLPEGYQEAAVRLVDAIEPIVRDLEAGERP